MKHTKGPWKVINWSGRAEIRTGDNKRTGIAFLGNSEDGAIPTGETTANAKLVAAAPELLEACKYVVQYHRENDSGEGELFGLDFVTTCINAIRKAEGA